MPRPPKNPALSGSCDQTWPRRASASTNVADGPSRPSPESRRWLRTADWSARSAYGAEGLVQLRGKPSRYDVRDHTLTEDRMPETATAAPPQCLRALERANQVRFARAELKRRVRAGRVSVADPILACPWQARTMPRSELLATQRGWGRTRCRRLLLGLQVP